MSLGGPFPLTPCHDSMMISQTALPSVQKPWDKVMEPNAGARADHTHPSRIGASLTPGMLGCKHLPASQGQGVSACV